MAHRAHDDYGCDYVRDKDGRTGRFQKEMERGNNLCDSCPYPECKALDCQISAICTAERKYWLAHLPEADKRVLARERDIREQLRAEKRKEQRNPTGRKRGWPKGKKRNAKA